MTFLPQTHRISDPLITLQHRLDGILKREHRRGQLLQTQDILGTWTSHRTESAHRTLIQFILKDAPILLTTHNPLNVFTVTALLVI